MNQPAEKRSYRLRPGRVEDIPSMLDLVRQLAEYEREPDAVIATEADYRKFGFGENPLFETVLAESDGRVVGFALFFFIFSTWTGKPSLYLEDLFVESAYRGRGIGRALFAQLARVAVKRGCERYQWQVLDWNQPSIEFYESHGGKATREWLPFRLEGDALRKLAAEAGDSA